MTQREEHERYLLKAILSQSITSENPSKEAIKKAYDESPSYFNEFKEDLLKKYAGKKLKDIKGSEVVSTDYGDTLKIVGKEKINFNIDDNDFKSQMNLNLSTSYCVFLYLKTYLDLIECLKNYK